MKRRLTLLFALLLALAVSGCSAAPSSSGKVLRIGVREDIPDFGYRNPDSDRFYGLEIDIAQEMAARMGYEAEFVAESAQERAEMLLAGEVDCLAACFTITDERREQFDFSAPYYQDETVAVVEISTLYGALDPLYNDRIGVLEGSTAEDIFTAGMAELGHEPATGLGGEGFTFAHYSSYDELSQALERGDITAMCMDNSIARKYMTNESGQNDNTLAGDKLFSISENDQGDRTSFVIPGGEQSYGVATVKGSPYSAPVAEAIDAMLADGTIDAICNKWL